MTSDDAIGAMGHSNAITEKLADREAELVRIQARLEASRAAPGAIDLT